MDKIWEDFFPFFFFFKENACKACLEQGRKSNLIFGNIKNFLLGLFIMSLHCVTPSVPANKKANSRISLF